MSKCTACGQSLTGGLDTFGDHDAPLCWGCYSPFIVCDPANEVEAWGSEFRRLQNEEFDWLENEKKARTE